MNGQVTMAQWLVENKNGKEWKKYGKERVYINVYVGGMQIANYFYDILTDRFFGCDSKTEKAIRAEYEKATETTTEEKIEEVVDEEYEKRYEEAERRREERNRKDLEEQRRWEEQRRKEREEYKRELEELKKREEEVKSEEVTTETEAKTEIKATASKISNELQNRFKMKQKEAQKEEMEIFKNLTSNIKDNLEESEIKDIVTDKKISQFFQLQLLKYIYEEFQKWIPSSKMTGGNFGIVEFVKKYDRDYFVTDLVFNRNFEKLVKSIKDFIKKGGD